MPKKISAKDKDEMIRGFTNGKTLEELSETFNCTKNTITRHLKKRLGENEYKETIKKSLYKTELNENVHEHNIFIASNPQEVFEETSNSDNQFPEESFMEIVPLNYEIDNELQKDLSSVPIADVDFPKIVYLVVDKKIELETKFLKEYPEWQFLSQDELNRKTIEIFVELRVAKRFCGKEQKVIKVTNTNVFKIVAPILVSRGISRIVSEEKLIAL